MKSKKLTKYNKYPITKSEGLKKRTQFMENIMEGAKYLIDKFPSDKRNDETAINQNKLEAKQTIKRTTRTTTVVVPKGPTITWSTMKERIDNRKYKKP